MSGPTGELLQPNVALPERGDLLLLLGQSHLQLQKEPQSCSLGLLLFYVGIKPKN